ncbi:MAG: TIGR02281 family clan AA aspartic protease [Hyphomicrobium sp.]
MLGWLVVTLVVLALMFAVLHGDLGSLVQADALDGTMQILAAALFGAYALYLFFGQSGRIGQAVRYLAAWAAIFLAFVGAYAFRSEITAVAYRVMGELVPPGHTVAVATTDTGERAVRVRRRPDGHFMARVEVNGAPVSMLVDTGASTVVLKPADAERAGIELKGLNFSVPVQTANGTTYAAPVRLRSITIGGIEVRDVETLVSKPGNLKESLLGMTFLKRLRSYEFAGEFLTLRS